MKLKIPVSIVYIENVIVVNTVLRLLGSDSGSTFFYWVISNQIGQRKITAVYKSKTLRTLWIYRLPIILNVTTALQLQVSPYTSHIRCLLEQPSAGVGLTVVSISGKPVSKALFSHKICKCTSLHWRKKACIRMFPIYRASFWRKFALVNFVNLTVCSAKILLAVYFNVPKFLSACFRGTLHVSNMEINFLTLLWRKTQGNLLESFHLPK